LLARIWREGNPHELSVGMFAIMENQIGVLQKLKLELAYDPAIPLLGINAKENKYVPQSSIFTSMLITALTTVKNGKQSKCASTEVSKDRKVKQFLSGA
jgi:hypothetical protein